jgi:hypothetical protein
VAPGVTLDVPARPVPVVGGASSVVGAWQRGERRESSGGGGGARWMGRRHNVRVMAECGGPVGGAMQRRGCRRVVERRWQQCEVRVGGWEGGGRGRGLATISCHRSRLGRWRAGGMQRRCGGGATAVVGGWWSVSGARGGKLPEMEAEGEW